MLPIPAIDIQSGKCVRLQKGDLSSTKIYFEKPIDAAAHWIKEGTKKLHLVDLDGAKSGKPENLEYVLKIKVKFPDVNLQLGGGVRDLETLDLIFKSGVDDVILGSIAIKDKELFTKACITFPKKIILGIDANTLVELGPFINYLSSLGFKEAISTSHSPSSLLATYNCNTKQETIDGIFVTADVKTHSSGLAAFDLPLGWPSDHRLAWIQITKESVLGDYLSTTKKVDMVEFQCGNPRQQERYQQISCQGCAAHQITKKIKALDQLGVSFLLGETKL